MRIARGSFRSDTTKAPSSTSRSRIFNINKNPVTINPHQKDKTSWLIEGRKRKKVESAPKKP